MKQGRSIIITVIFAFAMSATMYAQDIIVTVKAEKIVAKITEVDIEVVRYKQYDYQDGPVYIIKKSDIDSIVFQNGQTTVFEHPQEAEPPLQKIEETNLQEKNTEPIDNIKPISYEQFKKLNDRQMALFLKENDAKNYKIFHLGEMKNSTSKDLFVSGIVLTGIGGVSLLGGYVIVPLFALMALQFDFINYWYANVVPWLARIGLGAIIVGQPLLVASIVLKSQGKSLMRQAKNNYEDKAFKYNATSLNFNFYPNGFGISLKF